jgi:hypothetical protein
MDFTNDDGVVVGPDPLKARLDLWQKVWNASRSEPGLASTGPKNILGRRSENGSGRDHSRQRGGGLQRRTLLVPGAGKNRSPTMVVRAWQERRTRSLPIAERCMGQEENAGRSACARLVSKGTTR